MFNRLCYLTTVKSVVKKYLLGFGKCSDTLQYCKLVTLLVICVLVNVCFVMCVVELRVGLLCICIYIYIYLSYCSNVKVMDILKLEIEKKRKELEEKKLLVRCHVTNCDHSSMSHFLFSYICLHLFS